MSVCSRYSWWELLIIGSHVVSLPTFYILTERGLWVDLLVFGIFILNSLGYHLVDGHLLGDYGLEFSGFLVMENIITLSVIILPLQYICRFPNKTRYCSFIAFQYILILLSLSPERWTSVLDNPTIFSFCIYVINIIIGIIRAFKVMDSSILECSKLLQWKFFIIMIVCLAVGLILRFINNIDCYILVQTFWHIFGTTAILFAYMSKNLDIKMKSENTTSTPSKIFNDFNDLEL